MQEVGLLGRSIVQGVYYHTSPVKSSCLEGKRGKWMLHIYGTPTRVYGGVGDRVFNCVKNFPLSHVRNNAVHYSHHAATPSQAEWTGMVIAML